MTWRSLDAVLHEATQAEVDAYSYRDETSMERIRRKSEQDKLERANALNLIVPPKPRHELDRIDAFMQVGSFRFRAFCICGWKQRTSSLTRAGAERAYQTHDWEE